MATTNEMLRRGSAMGRQLARRMEGNFARGYSGNEESSGSGEAAYSNSFFHFSLIFFLKSGLKALTGGKRSFQA